MVSLTIFRSRSCDFSPRVFSRARTYLFSVSSMIRKSAKRFSLATNAERVCAEIMRKQQPKARWIHPDLIAL
jgi:hypothetical protein